MKIHKSVFKNISDKFDGKKILGGKNDWIWKVLCRCLQRSQQLFTPTTESSAEIYRNLVLVKWLKMDPRIIKIVYVGF
jgi:hypothetical protein